MIYIQHTASGIRAEREPFDGGVAYGDVASGWRPIESAPFNTPVEIKAGSMTFLARLEPDVSEDENGQSCDQWLAEIEGEHPPCWSAGACWSSNENDDRSLQPTAWRYPGVSANNELVEALSKGGFMMTETHNVGEYRGRKLVIGFQNPDDADDALGAIALAVKALRSATRANAVAAWDSANPLAILQEQSNG